MADQKQANLKAATAKDKEKAKEAKAKDAALQAAVTQIEKEFGQGSVMKLGDRGGVCAFVDAEHAIDPLYAKRIGVNTDELLISQPDYGEQALEIVDVLVRSGAVDVVAVDSVAALTPRVELEGQMGETQVGLQARLMSQALRKLAGNLNRAKTVCVFTNQIREKIGVSFGSPETQPGGRALKFYSSQRLDIRRIESLKEC